MKSRRVISSSVKRELLNEAFILSAQKKQVDFIINEINEMKYMGYSRYQINEQFEALLDLAKGGLSSLGGGAMESLFDAGKLTIARYIAGFLGIPEKYFDPQTNWISCAIANVIENIEFTKLTQYFNDETQCKALADLMIKSLMECFAEKKVIEKIADAAGIANLVQGSPLESQFSKFMSKETVSNMLVNSEFGVKLRDTIANFVCNLEIEKIMGQVSGAAGTAIEKLKGIAGDKK